MPDKDDPHALLPADYPDRDIEEVRRERNVRRRTVRRRRTRVRWLEQLRELEPETAAELDALKSSNPQAFRKGLVRAAKRLGFWSGTNRGAPRDLPPPEDRRREGEE